jgi:hypothetical protein
MAMAVEVAHAARTAGRGERNGARPVQILYPARLFPGAGMDRIGSPPQLEPGTSAPLTQAIARIANAVMLANKPIGSLTAPDGGDGDTLIFRSDRAMYRPSLTGGKEFGLFEAGMEAAQRAAGKVAPGHAA